MEINMKYTSAILVLLASLSASSAFAQSFKIACAGYAGYGPNDGSNVGITPAAIADSLNAQLAALAKTDTILNVTAPMASTGAGDGSSTNGDSHSISQLVCVTVTLQ
jgi:hypothetical protein